MKIARIETPTGYVIPKDLKVEVAREKDELLKGLMHRDSLLANHGMLFEFPEVRPQGVWMKNTKFPLDVMFIDEDGYIIKIVRNMEPMSKKIHSTEGSCKYALEVNAGYCNQHGISSGSRVDILEGKMSQYQILESYLSEQVPQFKVGDMILVGKFKNRRAIVKGFGKDKNNQPTVKTTKGEYSLFRFRINKLMPEDKRKQRIE